jgi:hypothetical protein
MNNLLPIVLVLILVICYCSYSNNDNKSGKSKDSNSLVICLLLVAVVVFFVLSDMKNKEDGFSNLYKYRKDSKIPKCGGLKQNRGNYPLYGSVNLHSPVGSPHQLTEDPASYSFPSVDGRKGSPRHLFQFANNQCHVDCCPGVYSCDKGCICQTPEQIARVNSRGGNKSYENSLLI